MFLPTPGDCAQVFLQTPGDCTLYYSRPQVTALCYSSRQSGPGSVRRAEFGAVERSPGGYRDHAVRAGTHPDDVTAEQAALFGRAVPLPQRAVPGENDVIGKSECWPLPSPIEETAH